MTELGCGISALVAVALAPSVQHYIATDQEYVRRVFRTNLEANAAVASATSTSGKQKASKAKGGSSGPTSKAKQPSKAATSNITFTRLDWELDQPELLKGCIESESGGHDKGEEEDRGFDLLLSCDCIYNEALVAPFVRTCAEICSLRPAFESSGEETSQTRLQPTICIVAQQQRAPEVFETWLRETLHEFRVWRLSDKVLGEGLKVGTGYLVHLLLVREKS